jgi:hypothetical protein
MFTQNQQLLIPLSQQVRTWVVRKEESGQVRWRLLPLHAAIIFRAPFRIVDCLLSAYPGAAAFKDDQGMLPLHLAFRQQPVVDFRIMEEILIAYPAGLTVRDRKGRTPMEASQSTPTSNFMQLFAQIIVGAAKQEWMQEQAHHAAANAPPPVDEKAIAKRAKAQAASEYATKLTELKDEFERELESKQALIDELTVELEDLKLDLEQKTYEEQESTPIRHTTSELALGLSLKTQNDELKLLVKNLLEQQAAWARQLQGWSAQQKKTHMARTQLLDKLATLDQETSLGSAEQRVTQAAVQTHNVQEQWTEEVQRTHSRMSERFEVILAKQDESARKSLSTVPNSLSSEEKKLDT